MIHTNFTNIIEEGGKTFLIDSALVESRTRQLRQLNEEYGKVIDLLTSAKLPIERDWCIAIAEKGADGLEAILKQKAEAEIERLQIPAFLQGPFKRTAISEVDSATWREADSLHLNIATLSDGLPTQFWQFAPDNKKAPKTFFPPEAYDAIKQSAKVEVAPELMEQSAKVWKLSREVRELELAGCNAMELIEQYCTREQQPQRLQSLCDIMQQRHDPGTVYDADIARLINETALKNITSHVG